MLVSKNTKICITPNANAKICVTPNTKPQRESLEYRLCWAQTQNSCIGHVYFIFAGVDFIRIGSRFSKEYGLKTIPEIVVNITTMLNLLKLCLVLTLKYVVVGYLSLVMGRGRYKIRDSRIGNVLSPPPPHFL